MALNHGSLFSGIGGFDLAAQWIGWDNIFQVEIDDWCRKVLAKNFPSTKRYSDIHDFNGYDYANKIDVISGGFPCQSFSVTGKRKGKADDRYLWPEMLRVINEIKPAFVVGENVTGIISLALDTVLSDLENSGYTTEAYIIPACGKNAWHRRDRVWIIAYSDSIRRQNPKSSRKHKRCNSFLADPDLSGCEKQWEHISTVKKLFAPQCESWWQTEPGMGGKINGFPSWLDKNINWLFVSHYCIFADGKLNNYSNGQTSKKRTEETLQNLRSEIREAAFREWAFGGFDDFFTEAALQSYLRKFEESINEAWVLLESKETHQEVVRSLRLYEVLTCASYRPRQNKQRTGKHSDTLQALSRFLAYNAKEAWTEYSRKNGFFVQNQWDDLGYWEVFTPRVVDGLPHRVDRLKGLGNAVVPQIAYEIFSAINDIMHSAN